MEEGYSDQSNGVTTISWTLQNIWVFKIPDVPLEDQVGFPSGWSVSVSLAIPLLKKIVIDSPKNKQMHSGAFKNTHFAHFIVTKTTPLSSLLLSFRLAGRPRFERMASALALYGYTNWAMKTHLSSLSNLPMPSVPPQSAVTPENSSFCDPNRAWELPSRACAHRYWQMSWRDEISFCWKREIKCIMLAY